MKCPNGCPSEPIEEEVTETYLGYPLVVDIWTCPDCDLSWTEKGSIRSGKLYGETIQ